MRRLARYAEGFLWALVGLAISLVALFFLLNILATKGPGPVGSGASFVAQRASGQAYGY